MMFFMAHEQKPKPTPSEVKELIESLVNSSIQFVQNNEVLPEKTKQETIDYLIQQKKYHIDLVEKKAEKE